MSIQWDDEGVLLLIRQFHENEILWNPIHPDYKNRNKRAERLRIIANLFGSNLDISEIERKLKNLTCHYYREKKKVDESRKSGVDSEYVYEPKWFAFKALNFLRDKNKPQDGEYNSGSTFDVKQENAFGSVSPQSTAPKRAKWSDEMDSKRQYAMDRGSDANNEDDRNVKKDEYYHWAMAFAADLRKMERTQRVYAKKAIAEILMEGQLGQLNRNSVKINVPENYEFNNPITVKQSSSPPLPIYVHIPKMENNDSSSPL